MSALSWQEYDRLTLEQQSELVCVRLPDGTCGWVHRSGQQARVLPPERVSDEEWATMSMMARWLYARSSSSAARS